MPLNGICDIKIHAKIFEFTIICQRVLCLQNVWNKPLNSFQQAIEKFIPNNRGQPYMPSRQQMPPPAHSSVESGSLQWPSSSGYSPQTYRASAVEDRLPQVSNCCKFGNVTHMRSFVKINPYLSRWRNHSVIYCCK